eukprot:UN16928
MWNATHLHRWIRWFQLKAQWKSRFHYHQNQNRKKMSSRCLKFANHRLCHFHQSCQLRTSLCHFHQSGTKLYLQYQQIRKLILKTNGKVRSTQLFKMINFHTSN